MLQTLKNIYIYLVNDWNTSGWKIRMVARVHMLNAIACELLYTYWMFGLPKGWDPSMPAYGPFTPRHFRIFCFFVYNISWFINCGQFFNGLLLYGCVDVGIKEKDITRETIQFYIFFSAVFIFISVLKFGMLFIYLDLGIVFSTLMTVPEIFGLVMGIVIVYLFTHELTRMERIEDKSTYVIGKNGKIIFN
ncbi:unnamed protein product [Allacma fusca]|uniref:Uncharacterized protein n=1 Tax=Allacma fusca TaxID=39272 RepID=A0A8J2JIE1_9HEXA|nr:unnamed protein product [Allacma fusca]